MILPLSPSFVDENGETCRPACCYIGNISRSTDKGVPPLLRYSEVKTMFHEFGHAMHCVCTATNRSLLSWAWPMVPWPGGVEQDFLEVPSMMFEQWMTEKQVILKVASHYSGDSDKSIDDDTIERLRKMRDLFYVTSHASYWAMSMFDLAVHGSTTTSSLEKNDDDDEFEHVKMYKEYMKKYARRSSVLGSDPVASWYHPAIGYDAGYYGYGWSEVYALDLFDKFRHVGVLNQSAGYLLRQKILSPCASKSGMDMLKSFLGREPSLDAFCRSHGC